MMMRTNALLEIFFHFSLLLSSKEIEMMKLLRIRIMKPRAAIKSELMKRAKLTKMQQKNRKEVCGFRILFFIVIESYNFLTLQA
jgi:hypothetical protein